MSNTNNDMDLRIVWIAAIVLGGLAVYQGLQGLGRGSPASEWIPMAVMGGAIIITVALINISYYVEDEQSSSDRFGVSDWTALIVTGGWMIIGTMLFLGELSSVESVVFSILGAIGFTGMLYKRYRTLN